MESPLSRLEAIGAGARIRSSICPSASVIDRAGTATAFSPRSTVGRASKPSGCDVCEAFVGDLVGNFSQRCQPGELVADLSDALPGGGAP